VGNLKASELANLCPDSVEELERAADDGLCRIGSDRELCLAFMRQTRFGYEPIAARHSANFFSRWILQSDGSALQPLAPETSSPPGVGGLAAESVNDLDGHGRAS
jgi:hypothetical protein